MTHEYHVIRKLQEQSGSYFITLPKLWVKSRNLKKHDKMSVTFNDIIKILPTKKGGE